MQSASVRSYISAIKRTLIDDGYNWDDNQLLLSSLTRACKLTNDTVKTRLPIQCGLLEVLLFEAQRKFQKENQPYLLILYQALFALGYYGLMRVGELTEGPHTLKAKDVHMATNKDKLLLVLYSSKTHDLSQRPQKIKITSSKDKRSTGYKERYFCPFNLIRQFIEARGDFLQDNEQFFCFQKQSCSKAATSKGSFEKSS